MSVSARIESENLKVTREPARADAPLETPACHVVELGDTVRNHERVVVGHTGHPSAQFDILRARERIGDEYVRRGDVLPHRREVLTYPCLGIAEIVQHLDLVKVVLECLCDIGPRRVQWHSEESDLHLSASM